MAARQDMERQVLLTEHLYQTYETRAQIAEQRAEEAEVWLEESEHRARKAEARLEELERRFHNIKPQTTDATALALYDVRPPPPHS